MINEYVGGGFGCKGWVWPHQLLAAMAARALGRPVKLVESRAQAYTDHGYQPASRQTVALAARADGTITGIRHDSILAGSFAGQHVEPAGWGTHAIYASPAIANDASPGPCRPRQPDADARPARRRRSRRRRDGDG